MLYIVAIIFFFWLLSQGSKLRELESDIILLKKKAGIKNPDVEVEFKTDLEGTLNESRSLSPFGTTIENILKPVSVPPPPPLKVVAKHKQAFEMRLGGNTFTYIGALAVLLGVGFFLKFAIDAGLISPFARYLACLVTGIFCLGLGLKLSKRYLNYGRVLSGLGIAILYLTVYAGYYLLSYYTLSATFVLLGLVAVLGVALAIRFDSLTMAMSSSIGAYLTPILLARGPESLHLTFGYLLVVSLGLVVVARFKAWKPLALASFGLVVLNVLSWILPNFVLDQWSALVVYLALLWAIFVAVSVFTFFHSNNDPDELDYVLLTLNPIIFYSFCYYVLHQIIGRDLGLVAVMVGLVYTVLALSFAARPTVRSHRFLEFVQYVAAFFFVLAVPIQFDKVIITLIWSLEAVVLLFAGCQLKLRTLRSASFVVYGLALGRLLVIDASLVVAQPWISDRALAFYAVILSNVFAVYCIYRYRDHFKAIIPFVTAFSLSLLFAVFMLGTLDISGFYDNALLAFFWPALAIVALVWGLVARSWGVRLSAGLLFVITLFQLLMTETFISIDNPWFNSRVCFWLVFALFAVLGQIAYLALNKQSSADESIAATNIFSITTYVSIFILVSMEIDNFYQGYWFSIAWAVIAISGILISRLISSSSVRWPAYGTFILAWIVAFSSTSSTAGYALIMNRRTGVFLILALSAALVLQILRSHRYLLPEEKTTASNIAVLSIHSSLLWLISWEVVEYYRYQMSLFTDKISSLLNWRNVSLSVAWLVYAVIILLIGIVRRSKVTRLGAIILLAVVIFKVFIYDPANLDNFTRFVSFITLGIILLAVGFLYNRFRDRIGQFIKAS